MNIESYVQRKGYLTLVSVLIVGAIGVVVAVSLLLLGLGSSRASFALVQLYEAKSLAYACAEEALGQIRDVPAYSGTGNLILGAGACSYEVSDFGASNKLVNAEGVVGAAVRRVVVSTSQIRPVVIIASWQDVADF